MMNFLLDPRPLLLSILCNGYARRSMPASFPVRTTILSSNAARHEHTFAVSGRRRYRDQAATCHFSEFRCTNLAILISFHPADRSDRSRDCVGLLPLVDIMKIGGVARSFAGASRLSGILTQNLMGPAR
jgi:hypothetical protein